MFLELPFSFSASVFAGVVSEDDVEDSRILLVDVGWVPGHVGIIRVDEKAVAWQTKTPRLADTPNNRFVVLLELVIFI